MQLEKEGLNHDTLDSELEADAAEPRMGSKQALEAHQWPLRDEQGRLRVNLHLQPGPARHQCAHSI